MGHPESDDSLGETLERRCQQLYTHMVTNPHSLSTGEAPLISQNLARYVLLKREDSLSGYGRQSAH